MKLLTTAFIILSFFPYTLQTCQYIELVRCFIDVLDEWAWTLYKLKDNVVTINHEECGNLRKLDACLEDSGAEKHQCDHNEIITASNTVSDLLTHRKNSGSFLNSYYLLKYACSQEGQDILRDHRQCLNNNRLGEMTLSAATYLSEKFLVHPDDQVCEELKNKLEEYTNAVKDICEADSAQLIMCRSLSSMFQGLHADKLHNCQFSCKSPEPKVEPEQEEETSDETETEDQSVAPERHSLNSTPSFRSKIALSNLVLFTSLAFFL